MAQIVDSSSFIFDGLSSDRFGLRIITTDSSGERRIFGLQGSLDTEDSLNGKVFLSRVNDTNTFKIEMSKVDKYGNTYAMSKKDYDDIIYWLYAEEPSILEVDGLIHYGMFKNGDEFHNTLRRGIISVEFESLYPYAFSPVSTFKTKVSNNKIIELENKSNIRARKGVYVDINIEKLKAAGDIKITNISTREVFNIKNIELNEVITVINGEVYSNTNPKKNLFNGLEYTSFIYLKNGVNKIKVEGDCNIVFKFQEPIALR